MSLKLATRTIIAVLCAPLFVFIEYQIRKRGGDKNYSFNSLFAHSL
ncbi:hypothetical protein HMPREF1557_00490 [Streptococcus sobrinus W1703]|uniref:Uncharacterized protein n=1 Tax=Streptococcus sobrinus W1703 TaxID=1227275 RepID=U2KL34_9STRE|nr:hypothetical protein HMPREF1557_00490 [Streptococcus sobrinus W1703]